MKILAVFKSFWDSSIKSVKTIGEKSLAKPVAREESVDMADMIRDMEWAKVVQKNLEEIKKTISNSDQMALIMDDPMAYDDLMVDYNYWMEELERLLKRYPSLKDSEGAVK